MKQVRSMLAIALTAIIVGCTAAPIQTTAAPVAASQYSAAAATATPAADSKRSRTILVLALLAGLIAAAVIIGATGDGDSY